MNRESYLMAAVEALRPTFKKANVEIPPLRVSTGWPSRGGVKAKNRAVGECWSAESAKDTKPQIFISPWLDVATGFDGVLSTLAHELVHAVAGNKAGHGPEFKKIAKAIGLEGKATSCGAGPTLLVELEAISAKLGEYPHAKLDKLAAPKKKQTTRMIKCECETCGYQVRTTKKWITEVGPPHCPLHKAMFVAAPENASGEVGETPEEDGDGENS